MDLATLEQLNTARSARTPVIVVTDIASGGARLVREADVAGDPLAEALAPRFRSAKSGMVTTGSGAEVLLTVHLPPPRLIVIGAVHISQALAPMARVAGFDMTIVDPRTGFASRERFPDVAMVAEWPDAALPKLGLDPFTALAALTHDPKIDDEAIVAALKAGCFYVGALGSRKTHGKRLERLRALGVEDAQLTRIHAPIGLPIGAQSPAEIAVSVLADVIRALRSRDVAGADPAV